MKSSTGWAVALSLAAAPVLAQSASTTTRSTTYSSDGKTITYTGTVTEYVPRKTLVIRDSNQKVVTYTLGPDLMVPADVQVGKTVTIHAEPGATGTVVRKVTSGLTSSGDLQTTTETTRTMPDGSTLTTTGTVVEFVPRKTLVVRDPGNHVVTYVLRPELTIPADVQVGKSVTVYADSSATGEPTVSKVVTTSMTPEGELKTTTRTTETSGGISTTTEETTVEGVVSAYQASKTVTVKRADGSTVSYVLDSASAVPADIAIGKHVILRVAPSGQQRIVRRITYTTVN